MARLTENASRQIDSLVEHFLLKERVEAIVRLYDAVQAAILKVDDPSTRWLTAPPPYPDLASDGFRWVREHRYWFAYTVEDDAASIHHVLYDAADITTRVREPSRRT